MHPPRRRWEARGAGEEGRKERKKDDGDEGKKTEQGTRKAISTVSPPRGEVQTAAPPCSSALQFSTVVSGTARPDQHNRTITAPGPRPAVRRRVMPTRRHISHPSPSSGNGMLLVLARLAVPAVAVFPAASYAHRPRPSASTNAYMHTPLQLCVCQRRARLTFQPLAIGSYLQAVPIAGQQPVLGRGLCPRLGSGRRERARRRLCGSWSRQGDPYITLHACLVAYGAYMPLSTYGVA